MTMFNIAKQMDGTSWVADDFRAMLLTTAYVPDVDQEFVADIVADETAGAGYSRQVLAGKAIVVDNAADRIDHDADTISWASLTAAFRYLVIFKFVTNDADSTLWEYVDLGSQSFTALAYEIRWNAGVASGTVFRGV